jgi:hypothetical protein
MSFQWLFTVLCFVTMCGNLCAQQPIITPNTPVSSQTLHQWLHSGDPRLVAWAADFTHRTHDAKIIAEMPALLARRVAPGQFNNDSQATSATLAILDTLIQEDTPVPVATVRSMADRFPVQALILITRYRIAETRPTLTEWANNASGFGIASTVARVASMLLAKDHPEPSFVAQVVAASEEELQIFIVSSIGRVAMGGFGGACGGGDSLSPHTGWPAAYIYNLAENDSNADAVQVVNLDGDTIYAKRIDSDKGSGSCGFVTPLNAQTRHRLIAHWLGVDDAKVPWQAKEKESIVWSGYAKYEQELGALTESHLQKLRATVTALHQRGLLKDDLATAPRLVVTIKCSMKPCPLP